MKVVYVIHSLATKGGAERIISEKMNCLASLDGYDITVITCYQDPEVTPNCYNLSDGVRQIHLRIPFHRQYHYSYPMRFWIKWKNFRQTRVELQKAIDDINPAESEDWKDHTGAYIDETFLVDFLTPEEFFAFLGKINNIPQAEIDERLKAYERLAGGEIFGQKKLIRNLSAGNKQKVGIMSALLMRPKLVILDEPFNFLDPSSQNILKHILTDYNRETGATILISSHNLAHTIDISTRIALLEKGQIIRDLPNAEGSARQELEDYFETAAES